MDCSQAVQHGFGLLTRNRRDFEDIPGLDLTLYVLAEQSVVRSMVSGRSRLSPCWLEQRLLDAVRFPL